MAARGGYQADFDAAKGWAGTLYGEKFRGVLAKRGEKATLKGGKRNVSSIGDAKELASHIVDAPEWNTYRIVAKGFVFKQYINDKLMAEFHDEDEKNRRDKGIIALQLHTGPPMTVQIRNIRLKNLSAAK